MFIKCIQNPGEGRKRMGQGCVLETQQRRKHNQAHRYGNRHRITSGWGNETFQPILLTDIVTVPSEAGRGGGCTSEMLRGRWWGSKLGQERWRAIEQHHKAKSKGRLQARGSIPQCTPRHQRKDRHPGTAISFVPYRENWKQLKCLSIKGSRSKLWCVYTMGYYTAPNKYIRFMRRKTYWQNTRHGIFLKGGALGKIRFRWGFYAQNEVWLTC